jgi:hypothetical protein
MNEPLQDPLAPAIDEEEEEEDHERRKGEEEPRESGDDGGGEGHAVETRGPMAPARRSGCGGSTEMRSPEFASEKCSPKQ